MGTALLEGMHVHYMHEQAASSVHSDKIFVWLLGPKCYLPRSAHVRLHCWHNCISALTVLCSYGAICQRYYTRLPTISLYTTAIGSVIAAGCVAISIVSRLIAGDVSNRG